MNKKNYYLCHNRDKKYYECEKKILCSVSLEKENEHSLKFRGWTEKMKALRGIQHHKCHMISSDVWAYKSPITGENICVGKS